MGAAAVAPILLQDHPRPSAARRCGGSGADGIVRQASRILREPTRMPLMNISLDDQSWQFNEEELEIRDAFAIKASTGLDLGPFLQGLATLDPASLQGLVWFCRRSAEPQLRLEDVNFKVFQLKLERAEPPAELA